MQDKNLLPLDDDIEQFHKSQEKKRKRNKRQKRHNNRLYHRLYRDFFVQVANELDIKLPAYQKISIKTSNEANDKLQYLIRTANSNTGSISEEASDKINDLQIKLDKTTKMVSGLKNKNADLKQKLQNYQNQPDEDTANNVNSASDTSNSVDNSDNADISDSASASSDSNSENNFNNNENLNSTWFTRNETNNTSNPDNQNNNQ